MSEETGCWSAESVWRGHSLLTARLRLRPLIEADVPAIAALLNDWEVARYTAQIPHPYDEADARTFVAEASRRRATGQGVALGMERVADGVLVGAVAFNMEIGQPELGYWVGRDYWGQGLATEALRRLCRHLFDDLGHTRVWADVHPDNAASRAVLAGAGFASDGLHPCDMPARCSSVMAVHYALAAEDWRGAHAARPMLLVAAAALMDADGRVLMATRPPGKMMSGLWEFPGGKVHAGETPESALVRELAEELGIDVRQSCLAPLAFASHDYDTFHLLMPLYAIRQWQGQPQALEGQSLRWVRPNRMADLPMPPADIPLVALLRDWV